MIEERWVSAEHFVQENCQVENDEVDSWVPSLLKGLGGALQYLFLSLQSEVGRGPRSKASWGGANFRDDSILLSDDFLWEGHDTRTVFLMVYAFVMHVFSVEYSEGMACSVFLVWPGSPHWSWRGTSGGWCYVSSRHETLLCFWLQLEFPVYFLFLKRMILGYMVPF